MIVDTEIWKDIPGCEYYQASTYGRIRSLYRILKTSNGISKSYKGTILKPGVNVGGYEYVNITENGQRKNRRVHTLVAVTFLKYDTNSVFVIDHIDGNKRHNHVDNLNIITHRENTLKGDLCTKNTTSKYPGVSRQKDRNKWRVSIRLFYTHIGLGCYSDEIEASKIYRKALSNFMLNEDFYKNNINKLTKSEIKEYLLN